MKKFIFLKVSFSFKYISLKVVFFNLIYCELAGKRQGKVMVLGLQLISFAVGANQQSPCRLIEIFV